LLLNHHLCSFATTLEADTFRLNPNDGSIYGLVKNLMSTKRTGAVTGNSFIIAIIISIQTEHNICFDCFIPFVQMPKRRRESSSGGRFGEDGGAAEATDGQGPFELQQVR